MSFGDHVVPVAVVNVYRCLPCGGHLLFYTGMSGSNPSPTSGLFRSQVRSDVMDGRD